MTAGLAKLADAPLAAILVSLIVLVGLAKVIAGDLGYVPFAGAVGPMVGLFAVGKGIHVGAKASAREGRR